MAQASLFFRELVAEWNRCHGAFYRLREEDFSWHEQRQDWLSYFPVKVAGVPLLLAQATDRGKEAGISSKTLWVSLFGEIPQDSIAAFSSGLDGLAREHGKTRLQLGGEEFHFLPGVPEGSALEGIARELGFTMADCADYAGPLSGSAMSSYANEASLRARRERWLLEPAQTPAQLEELEDFMAREFSGRWTREFRFWRARADTKRAFWSSLREDGGAVRGFSRLALRGDESGGWLPGALRFPLGNPFADKNTDACLGPIGVAASERGKGAGKLLLGLSLQLLLEKNAERVCIDWTNAYNYYKPLGLVVVRKYWSSWKDY